MRIMPYQRRAVIHSGMTDQPDPGAILIAKLLGAKARAADPRNLIDVSDLTSEQFAELLRQGGYAVTADAASVRGRASALRRRTGRLGSRWTGAQYGGGRQHLGCRTRRILVRPGLI